jgi:hypothetical protein
MNRRDKKSRRPSSSITERSPAKSVKAAQGPRVNEGGDLPTTSLLFMVFLYLLVPTVISGAMVVYYFYASSNGAFFFAIIVGLWVALRGFPTVIKRWFEKPIPTDLPYMHIFRLYFMLAFTLIPYLTVFSFIYYGLGDKSSDTCTNVVMTKISSLYFTTTTFTTTGFGDIHAVSNTCQAVVTVQMFSGFVIISILLAVLVSRLLQLLGGHASDA